MHETRESERDEPPYLARYLGGLPAGLRSFPSCQADASLVGRIVAAGALDGVPLPPELAPIVAPEAAVEGGWIPEVAHVAIILAVRDARFPGSAGDDAVTRWMAEVSRPLAMPWAQAARSTPGDPAAAVRAMPEVWARHHRGTAIEIAWPSDRTARLVHHHPDGLFPRVVLAWRRRVILSMLAAAGATAPSAVFAQRLGTGTEVTITW